LMGETTNIEVNENEKEKEKEKEKETETTNSTTTYITTLYWKPTATINLVVDQTAYPKSQLTSDVVEL